MKKNVAILGSTGSIGKSALAVIKNIKKYRLLLIFFNNNYKLGLDQIKKFKPKFVLVSNYNVYLKLKKKNINKKIKILSSYEECKKYLIKIDICISAISGIKGLEPTLFFTKLSKKVLIANKESIICGWDLIKKLAKNNKTELIPIDSEHFSIHFLLKFYSINLIKKIYITASGGPFLNLSKKELKFIKPHEAIKHPKWKMGKKISVDSATLMNKILEVIEASKLFSMDLNKFEIIIHPESLVHSILELKNGLRVFLYHEPDMKITIANALVNSDNLINVPNYSKKKINNKLNFFNVDKNKFPVVGLLKKINVNNSSSILLNAANEIYVEEFLKKNLIFTDIYRFLKLFLNSNEYIKTSKIKPNSIKIVKKIDLIGRKLAFKIIRENA